MGRTNWRAGARATRPIAYAVPKPSPTYIDQHLLDEATLLHGMTTMKATLNAPHGIIYSFKIIGISGAEISIYVVAGCRRGKLFTSCLAKQWVPNLQWNSKVLSLDHLFSDFAFWKKKFYRLPSAPHNWNKVAKLCQINQHFFREIRFQTSPKVILAATFFPKLVF